MHSSILLSAVPWSQLCAELHSFVIFPYINRDVWVSLNILPLRVGPRNFCIVYEEHYGNAT